jgi:predicted amidohydrolase YtcJ
VAQGLFADLVVRGGRIVTLGADQPCAEALAVRDGRLVYVGDDGGVTAFVGPATRVVELSGQTVLPGLIDAHAHLADGAVVMSRSADVTCEATASVREALAVLRRRAEATPRGQWVVGIGSGNADRVWPEGRLPSRAELDEAAPDHPLLVVHPHLGLANSAALRLAGITAATPDPAPGYLGRDPTSGEPSGLLVEWPAVDLVRELIPKPTIDDYVEAIEQAQSGLLASGATSVYDIVQDARPIRAYQRLKAEGRLAIRITLLIRVHEAEIELDDLLRLGLENGFGDDWLRIGGVKISYDGGISARLAAFYEPYVGEPDNRGMTRLSRELLKEKCERAHRHGLSVCVHAYGDRAFDDVVGVWEEILAAHSRRDHRHRIEHGGNWLMTAERRERVKRLGLILVPNLAYIPARGDVLTTILGPERMRDAFPLRTLLKEGVLFTSGSDAAYGTHPIHPLRDVGAAVARRTASGRLLEPSQAISVEAALRMQTLQAAFAAFEEGARGSLEAGKLADFIVLAESPWEVAPERIQDLVVELAVVGGQVRYAV